MIETEKRTDFLFPKRNFLTGFSNVLNLFAAGSKFNTSQDSSEADFKAIKTDWDMVGQDFRKSMSEHTF